MQLILLLEFLLLIKNQPKYIWLRSKFDFIKLFLIQTEKKSPLKKAGI